MTARRAASKQHRDEVPEGCPLSVRELQVLAGLSRGLVAKQIAAELGLSQSTVRSFTHSAYQRLGVDDRAQAVIRCWREGWIDDAGRIQVAPRPPKRADRVTPAQALYLQAFERWLRTEDDLDREEMYVLARVVKREAAPDGVLRRRFEEELAVRRGTGRLLRDLRRR